MGQIVGGSARPKRCNLNKLSQLDTPAAGEHILVSSDNSMNAAGQGHFDSYIVGTGNVAAPELPLHKFKAEELEAELFGETTPVTLITKTLDPSVSNSRYIGIRSLEYNKQYTIRVTAAAQISLITILQRTSESGTNTSTIVRNGPTLAIGESIEYTFTRDDTANCILVMQGNGTGASGTVEIIGSTTTDGVIDELNAAISGKASANDVEYIQQQIQEAEFVGASASTNAFHFIAGKTYRIEYFDVATSGVNLSARITANDTATAVSIANGLTGTGSVTFTPSQDFYFLRASAKASLRVYVDGSIIGNIVTKDDISAIETELDGKVNVKLGKNLFNKDSNLLKDGYIFNSAGDLVGGSTGYYWLISNPIDVSGHQGEYIICNKSYTHSSRYNLFVAADGTKTTIPCSTSAIQIPANAVTAYIAVYKTGGSVNLDEVQIEFGTAVSDYEPYNPIAGYLDDEMSSQFTFPPCPQESLHDTYATELTAAAVWARWDALVARHPSYITKTDLGADTSGDYHIYGYSINFSPAPVYKMLFVCNQHGGSQAGDQPMGALVSAIMAEDIDGCKHRHNDLLTWIRKNVSINVIPVANPWGIDHKSRYNSAGVDLNRNWPASSWDASTDEHKGSAAGSSLEVQHIMSFITQISPDVIIDNHTLGGVDGSADANSGYFIMGFPKSYTNDRNAYDAFFNSASATLLPEYGFQLSTGYSSPTSHNDPDLRMWGYENGYYGGLIEMNWRDPLNGNLGFTANTIEASYMFALLVYQYYKEALG